MITFHIYHASGALEPFSNNFHSNHMNKIDSISILTIKKWRFWEALFKLPKVMLSGKWESQNLKPALCVQEERALQTEAHRS